MCWIRKLITRRNDTYKKQKNGLNSQNNTKLFDYIYYDFIQQFVIRNFSGIFDKDFVIN